MTLRRFRHQDRDYLAWRGENPAGFVANIDESDAAGTRIHHASCWTLQSPIDRGTDLTCSFPKVCSTDLEELRAGTGRPRSCGHCSP